MTRDAKAVPRRARRTKPFSVIVADPPWPFRDRLPGRGRGAAKHYDLLSLDDIRRFELPPIADDAWLFLWRVASMPEEALDAVHAWGFTPKSEIVWVKGNGSKLTMGMGRSVRNCHETCIVATRGRPQRLSKGIRSVFHAPRQRHSQKPEAFFELIETLAPGPYVELFARRRRAGWTCFGDELRGSTR